MPLGVIQEKGENSGLDTRVYCCPIPLDFRKRVVYFSYTFKVYLKTQDFLDVCTLTAVSTRSISSLLHLGHFSFVFVMLLERFDNVKIMTATVTFEFVNWHGV